MKSPNMGENSHRRLLSSSVNLVSFNDFKNIVNAPANKEEMKKKAKEVRDRRNRSLNTRISNITGRANDHNKVSQISKEKVSAYKTRHSKTFFAVPHSHSPNRTRNIRDSIYRTVE